jgi:tRNA/rRNA methyltransferase
LVPTQESDSAVSNRAERRAWLLGRGYRVIDVQAAAVEADLPRVLDHLAEELG